MEEAEKEYIEDLKKYFENRNISSKTKRNIII